MKPVRFTPPALNELTDSAAWYESQEIGLSDRFRQECEHQLSLIRERPASFPVIHEIAAVQVHRALLSRFPYSLIFLELEEEIRIVAVAHQKRRPAYWLRRV